MATRPVPFQIDEWFHCYSRGIDKRTVYESEDDAERFLQLLYLVNSSEDLRRDNLSLKTEKIMAHSRGEPLVSIGAYCLMPNHYHLLLKEIREDGISRFMQKLGTAYTMYFNKKYDRVGGLFVKPFRARHVVDDRYFQKVVDYIHCNPAELYEPGWKKGAVRNIDRLEQQLLQYRYSSFADYNGKKRPHATILSRDGFDTYVPQTPKKMLAEARAYYADITMDDPSIAVPPSKTK
jgi:putative transposase